MTGEWIGAAESLAEGARELGFDVARTVASAWRARCLPEATLSLTYAARALTSEDAKPRFFDREDPFRTASDLLATVEEHEAHTAVLSGQVARMAAACVNTRDRAIADYHAAERPPERAQPVPDRERTRSLITETVVGDCDAALDLLAQVTERLGYAITCFRRAPAEYAEAYDVPLQFIHEGGVLPWSGDFLTSAITNGAQR